MRVENFDLVRQLVDRRMDIDTLIKTTFIKIESEVSPRGRIYLQEPQEKTKHPAQIRSRDIDARFQRRLKDNLESYKLEIEMFLKELGVEA